MGQPLLDEWAVLVDHRAELSSTLRATGWMPHRPSQAGVEPADADDALGDLVREAADDVLAARVVLQRILPGLIAIARRRARGARGPAYEAFDELLGTGWIVIRAFPIDRRPHQVAANLLREIEYQTFTRGARRVMARREIPSRLDEEVAETGRGSAFVELVEVLADGAAAGMAPGDLLFAVDLANGATVPELAAQRGQTHRALRYRRHRVAAQLRAATLGWNESDGSC